MERVEPSRELWRIPCSNVAISCALGYKIEKKTTHEDGYMTLKDNNKAVREFLDVKRYKYFKRTERVRLRDLSVKKAIVCVLGHIVYLEDGRYFSFFDNENDEVVAYWELN